MTISAARNCTFFILLFYYFILLLYSILIILFYYQVYVYHSEYQHKIRKFSQKCGLVQPQRVHSGERPSVFDTFVKLFAKKDTLKTH